MNLILVFSDSSFVFTFRDVCSGHIRRFDRDQGKHTEADFTKTIDNMSELGRNSNVANMNFETRSEISFYFKGHTEWAI